MCKLSAFLCISMDLVELGPEWMDAYARETLSEAIACACEAGAVAGTGKDEPIGMIRDMAADVSPTTGYAKQTPVKVKKLDPATMGALLKKLARDPNDSTGKTARVVDPRYRRKHNLHEQHAERAEQVRQHSCQNLAR